MGGAGRRSGLKHVLVFTFDGGEEARTRGVSAGVAGASVGLAGGGWGGMGGWGG